MIKRLLQWWFRLRYFWVGLDIATLEARQQHIAAELRDARRRESLLMVDAMVKGLL